MSEPISVDSQAPLHEVVGVVAAFWTFAIVGYYYLFPFFGYSLDYNLSAVPIALYFLAWSIASTLYFWKLFRPWVTHDLHVWRLGLLSLGTALVLVGLLQALSFFPTLRGPRLAPYTDLLFVTPWYFLPKAFEVLLQQVLIATLVLEFYARSKSFRDTLIGYAFCFVGAHIVLFALNGTPSLYAGAITAWAAVSTALFPYVLLRVRGGFVYTYAIHLASYVVLAMMLRTWPPPGYFGI